MTEDMRLFWETYNEHYTNELIIHESFNPIRSFEKELIDGPILDIGCGQSNFLIEYSVSGRELFAIDNEDYQLKTLSQRINDYAGDRKGKVNFLNMSLPKDELPNEIFSLVIMSNFLQFFPIEECEIIINNLIERTKEGSLIYVLVHSDKHPYNKSEDEKTNTYFKHFFSEDDLNQIFKDSHFERLYLSDSQFTIPKFDMEIRKIWCEKILDYRNITDQTKRKNFIDANLKEKCVASLTSIYRRK